MSARPRRTAPMMRSSSAISSSEAFSGSLLRASSTACLSVIDEKYPFPFHAASCYTARPPNPKDHRPRAIRSRHETKIPARGSVHPLVRPSGKLFQDGLREKLVDLAMPGDWLRHPCARVLIPIVFPSMSNENAPPFPLFSVRALGVSRHLQLSHLSNRRNVPARQIRVQVAQMLLKILQNCAHGLMLLSISAKTSSGTAIIASFARLTRILNLFANGCMYGLTSK